ncbi:transposase [Streptomyces ferrugineus]|uniref:Transposase n=1 Tax=Streptomyces ferrugineus TaxID=1413221 RepID=A0A7M2SAT0_9ACTN|nr:transposase [Streptomyces ferrugineus]QOV33372.1 transposase [Streptomyces ferrugineus]
MAVTAAGTKRSSLAGLIATEPGRRPRLIYRTLVDRGPRRQRKGFTATDYARLPDAAQPTSDSATRSRWSGTT